jgi:hypothetical protein
MQQFTSEGKQEVVCTLGVASRGASSDHMDSLAALDWEDPVKPDRHVLQMPLCHLSWLQLNFRCFRFIALAFHPYS